MQALGSSIVDLLLGEYIEGVDQRQLELDVLNGHLLLQNLAVKDVALQRLQLPVLVKAGIIGKVELDIPWSHLKSQPTKLRMENILLLVGPQSEAEWDQAEQDRRVALAKEATLTSHEKRSAQAKATVAQRARPQRKTWAASLSAMVLERLQVDITNVVVRYVDSSHGPYTYSITLGIESISMRPREHRSDDADAAADAGGRGRRPSAEDGSSSSALHKVRAHARARTRTHAHARARTRTHAHARARTPRRTPRRMPRPHRLPRPRPRHLPLLRAPLASIHPPC